MRNPYDLIGRLGLLLAVIGAVNWLLVGLFEWNLVKWIFTQSATQTVDNLGERIVYIVIGVGGVLAIPMLAATLSRARGRGVRSGEGDESGRTADVDDTSYYYGAPKGVRAEDRSDVAAASAEGRPAEQSGPVRKTERVIIRTEEPITGSTESSTSSETVTEEPGTTDRSLRYGSVEEADDDLGEERRRAA
jgi:uncharacterized membrane protein YuzA (DUF378 family)